MIKYKTAVLKALFHTIKPLPTCLLGACVVYAHAGFSARLVMHQENAFPLMPAEVFGMQSPSPLDKATLSFDKNKILTLTLAQSPSPKPIALRGEKKISAYVANLACQGCSQAKKKNLAAALTYSAFLKEHPALKRTHAKTLGAYLTFLNQTITKKKCRLPWCNIKKTEYYALALTGASATLKDLYATAHQSSKEMAQYYIEKSDPTTLPKRIVENLCGNTCGNDTVTEAAEALDSTLSTASIDVEALSLSIVLDAYRENLEVWDSADFLIAVDKASDLALEGIYGVSLDTLREVSVAVEERHATAGARAKEEQKKAVETLTLSGVAALAATAQESEVGATNSIVPPLTCEIIQA